MNQNEYHKKFLFIDDARVVKVENLTRRTNQAVKHPEPIFKMEAPWDTPNDELGALNVLYDPVDKQFKMWYTAMSRLVDWGGSSEKTAHAVSADGIHWERPILNRVDHNGSKENNYILPIELENCNFSILIDPSDASERRFKSIFVASNIYGSGRVADWANHHTCLNLASSENGVDWDVPTFINPVLRGISDGVFMFHYDAIRRKYQIFARRVPNLPRDISLYESFDLVNWEDCGRIFVAGDECDPPTLYNIHGATVLQYEDYKLALLNTMHLHPMSEDLGVFNEPPEECEWKYDVGRMDLQLGYSTDGRTWQRAHDRREVVPTGDPGDLDAGMILPQLNSPIVVDGDTYIFYSGWETLHNAWSQARVYQKIKRDMRLANFGMLAVMPEDHWVSMDAGADEGSLLAGPWRMLPRRFLINADAEGGSVEVELVDGYERPLPGFSRADCIPITTSGKNQQVHWKGDPHPCEVDAETRGGFMARITLKNAKLYSCTLAQSDSEGTARRYWNNIEWNKNLFHQRDQWDKDNNLPASGVPPVTRGLPNY
jgi:hypothetical protein